MRESKEISVADIVSAGNRNRKLILAFAGVFCVAGLIYSIFAEPVYTGTTTVVLADAGEGTSLSPFVGGLGSVAALAGINLNGGGANRQTYLAILRSAELGRTFIAEQHLMQHLFPDRWDEKTQSWKPSRPSILDTFTVFAKGSSGKASKEAGPSSWQAYQRFETIRDIKEDTASGTVSVSFRFRDPELAAEWANSFVALANDEIRNRTVKEASQALEYLNQRVQSTNIVGLRETIYRLVESHLEKITLANARQDFAFRVIDKAVAPEERSWPRRKQILVVSLLLGAALGFFVALIKDFYILERRSE